MTGRAALGIVLALLGSLAGAPLVVLLGLAAVLLEGIRWIWQRGGLAQVSYERRLATDRAVVGDVVPLEIEVWNRKRLPLAWLRAEDAASEGLQVRERELVPTEWFGHALANAWSLAPFERVVRRFHVETGRRGVHTLGPVRLT